MWEGCAMWLMSRRVLEKEGRSAMIRREPDISEVNCSKARGIDGIPLCGPVPACMGCDVSSCHEVIN